MKKILMAIASAALACGIGFAAVGCGNSGDILVVSREEGSGTRSAFTELTGILTEDENGEEVDRTVDSAEFIDSTGAVLDYVSGAEKAIGYISYGSLDDTVKAIQVDGVSPSAETIKDGSYKISRPFNIPYKADNYNDNDLLQDFVEFVLSTEGQAIVADENYLPIENTQAYVTEESFTTKKIVVAGSSSVTPVMELIIEEYESLNANKGIDVELQSSDSSTGMTNTMNDTADLGMASRALKDSETAELTGVIMATDGIAVIVNNANPCTGLTMEQICNIYIGEALNWSDVGVEFTE